jgi:hypothetical protein
LVSPTPSANRRSVVSVELSRDCDAEMTIVVTPLLLDA